MIKNICYLNKHNIFDRITIWNYYERSKHMKAYVDQDGCISCGLCMDICPEVFSYNDDGVPEAIKEDIPKDCTERAEEARDGCPTSVIDLEE